MYYSMESAKKRRVENWAVTENKEFCDSPVLCHSPGLHETLVTAAITSKLSIKNSVL